MGTSLDVAFSDTVKAIQEQRGSRDAYARVEAKGGWPDRITPEVAAFIGHASSFYLATTSRDGQPYVQHRGGPRGFLRVLDEKSLGFADFKGNRQYITIGNLRDNPRAFIFLMDYAFRRRLKIWGRAEVIDAGSEIARRLAPGGGGLEIEQAVVFTVEAWNWNCPQHIPQKLDAEDVAAALAKLETRIRSLEKENAALLARLHGVDTT